MNEQARARIKAALRPFAEEAIRPEDVKVAKIVNQIATNSGQIRVERLSGPIPANMTGVVQDESIEVHFPAYSSTTNLQDLLDEIITNLTVASITVGEVDGSPSAPVRTILFPNDSLDINTDTEIATYTPAFAGSGQYRQYVVLSDGSGGFDFVDDGTGHPTFTLEDLE